MSIRNCIVRGNSAGTGGGISIDILDPSGGPAEVIDCLITDNRATMGNGGGLWFIGRSTDASFLVKRCEILRNSAKTSGGGLFIGNASFLTGARSVTVSECFISENSAESNGGGGCLWASVDPDAEYITESCVISENHSGRSGAWQLSNSGGANTVVNCLVVDNSVGVGSRGGIVALPSRGSTQKVYVTNSTIVGNEGYGIYNYGGDFMTVINCVVRGSGEEEIYSRNDLTVAHSNVEGGWEGESNIDADPLFADAANGDYHLTDGSPCIDTGTADGAPDTDFEGDARPQGDGFDMGADEFGGGAACDLEVELSGYPEEILRGDYLSFDATASNSCDDSLAFDQAVMTVSGPASLEKTLYDGAPFLVFGSVGASVTLPVPNGAPMGSYTVEVTIYRDGEAIHADAFEVEVSG